MSPLTTIASGSRVASEDLPAVEVRRVDKAFSGLRVLDGVSLSIRAGEVRALMGRNGAGKSTLVRVLSGVLRPDAGEIRLGDRRVEFTSPRDALAAGIATVHQELSMVPGLTAMENITLGRWPSRNGIFLRKEAAEVARKSLDFLGESLDLNQEVETLSLAQRQIIEIARAISADSRLLILDEPTSSLPQTEVERVLKLVRRLAEGGVAIIYVSHRMDEIARVASSVTVVRDGRVVATLPIAEATSDRIADLMVGEDLRGGRGHELGDPSHSERLRVRDLRAGSRLAMDAFTVRKGEVVGVAGLLGAGRTEFLRCIAGVDDFDQGSIEVDGRLVSTRGVDHAMRSGIALVPEDRMKEGLVLDLPIADNLVMSCLSAVSRLGVLSGAKESSVTRSSVKAFDIVCGSLSAFASTLSGGNQQKVVFARCLNRGVSVLLLDEPTRGVDVHAKAQIYQLIWRFAADGGAVVMVSSEYEELFLACHRIVLMKNGALAGELDPKASSMNDLLAELLRSSDDVRSNVQ